ncbi:hypothetical protein B7Z17_00695 [Candidatus Saccharibacteria bacterium 32-49-10]|nr:MAG: hypothetical protein B7Z17_00695 [Candidatus Saccharibacteria bacterium 32-49-10]
MNYLVLGGGISPEKDVSHRSATAVKQALVAIGHTVTYLDPADKSTEELIEQAAKYDGVFPILHGIGGEDGALQTEFDTAEIAYFGPRPDACRNTFDKAVFKRLLEAHSLPTPRWNIISANQLATEPLTKQPFVLKPISGGSSIDTFIVRQIPFDDEPLLEALNRYGTMLIEELIVGHEVTVGILKDTALPVVEIIPPADQDFDYENKYNGATTELCPPENVSDEQQATAQLLALQVHRISDCGHLSRTDIMIDSDGHHFIIDTNTMPGLTDQSLFPKAAATAGYSWTELVEQFTKLIK